MFHILYYKTIFFAERGNHTPRYMLEPITFFAILTIASMWVSSHALCCEMGSLGTIDESGWLCILYPQQVPESKYHTSIQCFAFDHIGLCFPHIIDQTNPFTNFSHDHNVHSWLEYSLVKFLNFESRYTLSHVLCGSLLASNNIQTGVNNTSSLLG